VIDLQRRVLDAEVIAHTTLQVDHATRQLLSISRGGGDVAPH